MKNDEMAAIRKRLAEAKDAIAGKRRCRGRSSSLVCDVVGLRYVENLAEKLREVEDGCELSLLRDPGNAHDANAIAVVAQSGHRIGWIPRAQNEEVASRMDRGEALSARVLSISHKLAAESVTIEVGRF